MQEDDNPQPNEIQRLVLRRAISVDAISLDLGCRSAVLSGQNCLLRIDLNYSRGPDALNATKRATEPIGPPSVCRKCPKCPDLTSKNIKAADAKELHRAVREEGQFELDRPAASLLWSGLAGGLAITASLIAEAVLFQAVPSSPWSALIVGLGYPLGFMIVVLGRMQFFTESTITAMLPLATRPSWNTASQTIRLWCLVLIANLAGTALATAGFATLPLVDASLREGLVAVSAVILHHEAIATFWTAIPAGFLIAAMAWLLPNAREQSFWLIFVITYVVGVSGFSHSIVGSAEAFTLVWAGRLDLIEAMAGSILPAVLGNLVGGAGLFALLAHGQVRPEMMQAREDAAAENTSNHE